MDVAQVMIDELIEADEAFAGNRLLSTFYAEARALIEPVGVMIELASGEWSWTAATRSSPACFRSARR